MNKVKKDMKEKKSVGKKKVGNEKLGETLCGKNEIFGETYSFINNYSDVFIKRRYKPNKCSWKCTCCNVLRNVAKGTLFSNASLKCHNIPLIVADLKTSLKKGRINPDFL